MAGPYEGTLVMNHLDSNYLTLKKPLAISLCCQLLRNIMSQPMSIHATKLQVQFVFGLAPTPSNPTRAHPRGYRRPYFPRKLYVSLWSPVRRMFPPEPAVRGPRTKQYNSTWHENLFCRYTGHLCSNRWTYLKNHIQISISSMYLHRHV